MEERKKIVLELEAPTEKMAEVVLCETFEVNTMCIFDVDGWVNEGRSGSVPQWEKLDNELYVAAYNSGRRMAGLNPLETYSYHAQAGCASRLDSEHPTSFRADA